MKIGMFTYGYQRYPLKKAFNDAKRFGYDYIELWGGRPHAYAPDVLRDGAKEIRELIQIYDMPVKVYTPEHNAYPYNFMAGSEWQRQDAVKYLKKALEAGKVIGTEMTLISTGHAGYDIDKKEIEKRLYEALAELSSFAEKIGHKIVLETLTHYETNVCTTADDLREVIDKINSPALGGMCDIVQPFAAGEPVMNYFDKLGNRIEHLHIVDNDGESDVHLIPGDGIIPLKELMWEIKARGYNKTATLELVSAYMNEPSLYAKRALDRLKELMR